METRHARGEAGEEGERDLRQREPEASGEFATVEEALRQKLIEMLGGPRGGLETAAPGAAFAFAYSWTGRMAESLVVAGGVALALLAARLVQGSSTHYALNGVVCIAIGAAFAYILGGERSAENVFLPGIIVNAVFPLLLGASVLLRRPLFGYVIGEILGDTGAMRRDAGVMKLADRITLLLIAPGVIRVCVDLPLYLGGKVGWFGVTSLVFGWPLFAAVIAVAGVVLARGHTPLEHPAALSSRS